MVVNEALPHIMSTQHFLEEQGYKLKKSTLYQHNKSAMIMEKMAKQQNQKRPNTQHFGIFCRRQN